MAVRFFSPFSFSTRVSSVADLSGVARYRVRIFWQWGTSLSCRQSAQWGRKAGRVMEERGWGRETDGDVSGHVTLDDAEGGVSQEI